MTMDSELKNSLAIGIKLFQNREYEKAEKLLLKVLESKEDLPDVHNMLGLIYHDQEMFSKSVKCFERALEINPDYTEASINLAVVSSDIGLHKEAKKTLSKIAARQNKKKKGELDPYLRGKLSNMYTEIGDLYKSIGKTQEAKTEYEKALKLSPNFVDIWVKLGNALRDAKMYGRAVEIYKKARKFGKDYAPIGLNLGIAYYSQGERKKAKTEWDRVLKRDPANTMAKTYLKLFKK